MSSSQFTERFKELDERGAKVPVHFGNNNVQYVSALEYAQWVVSCMHLLEATFGPDGAHARTFAATAKADQHSTVRDLAVALGIFRAAREDWDQGLATALNLQISSDILADLIGLAKISLVAGHKDTAAVLAACALEDALKRFALSKGILLTNQDMEGTINALRSKGLLSGAENKLVGIYPKLRNAAMHADWANVKETEVGSLIGFTEQFLLTHFK